MTLAAAVAVVAVAEPARPETVLERAIEIEVGADGVLHEATRLVVRIDDADDARAWSVYRLFLDANRQLVDLEAEVASAGGGRRRLGAEAVEEAPAAAGAVLHGSQRALTVRLAPLAAGDRITLRHTIRFAPYFAASYVNLRGPGAIADLRIAVTRADGPLRWHLEGPDAGLEVRADGGAVTVRARALPALPRREHLPADRTRARLHFAWGEIDDWAGVARWYRGQMEGLAGASERTRAVARELAAEAAAPRDRLDRLLAFLAERIRYVAVTVGEGNLLPAPPDVTLERGWGDCKDQTLLLVEMLASVGVAAYPALVRLDADGRVDPSFPSLVPFNHAITAVPLGELAEGAGGPAADGFLFVDATQQRAAGRWLVPALQGQRALVVKEAGGRLVETPVLSGRERRRLEADLVLDSSGDAAGTLALDLEGGPAYTALAWLDTLAEADARAEARALLRSLVPGATLSDVTIAPLAGSVPRVRIGARAALPGWARGMAGPRPSLQVPGMRAAPDPALFTGRSEDAVVPAIRAEASWRLALPAAVACRPAGVEVEIDRPVGRFAQRVGFEGGALLIERATEIRQRFVAGADLADLEAIALAEHRAHRRRVRLTCDD